MHMQPDIHMPRTPEIKEYQALFGQTGTAQPTITLLKNTLGGTINWNRVDVGYYQAHGQGLFTVGKTIVLPFGDGYAIALPIVSTSAITGFIAAYPDGDGNYIDVLTFANTAGFPNTDYSTLANPTQFIINILVYQ